MPVTQEIVIPNTIRQTLVSGVHEILKNESNELRKVREELKAATQKRTRTAGWREQEGQYRRRVELLTALLTVLQTGRFNPPAGSGLPTVILQEAVARVSFLEKGLTIAKGVYRRAVEIRAEVREILNIRSI